MKDESRSRARVWAASMLVLATLLSTQVAAQEPPAAATSPAEAAATPAAEPKARKKPRGRLPTYYSRVVSTKQRSDIYAIQAKYAVQIDKLQDQLKMLTKQRDTEVEKVLTPDQLAEVAELNRERAKRRKSRSSASTGGSETAD